MKNLQAILKELVHAGGVASAVVVSRDGFVIESDRGSAQADPEAVGAVISTGIGMLDSIGGELSIGSLNQCMIEYSGGIVMLSRAGGDAILVVTAELSANLGHIRYLVKKAAPEVENSL